MTTWFWPSTAWGFNLRKMTQLTHPMFSKDFSSSNVFQHLPTVLWGFRLLDVFFRHSRFFLWPGFSTEGVLSWPPWSSFESWGVHQWGYRLPCCMVFVGDGKSEHQMITGVAPWPNGNPQLKSLILAQPYGVTDLRTSLSMACAPWVCEKLNCCNAIYRWNNLADSLSNCCNNFYFPFRPQWCFMSQWCLNRRWTVRRLSRRTGLSCG